ncbi:uncharacterized protein N7479_005814 [Penicillium vulpinum]|uniref:Uncharacterized protein n=1 Tax=Penicillium vulpinum TaxID=29845 RepID=A0A1V6SEG5_9EURO|nr:uncharacterized protein N7479_005814 [Penicillium vulpinum]KAJ5958664.1 hypothetical protein N7479_005814 [Penicillium vulpinum]OQE12159.1 hypothetical protein PENVUL_c001G08455 [Penicillium vulpinum]
MQPDIQSSTLRTFQETRDEFSKDLENLSLGRSGGRYVPVIQSDLRRLINTLSMWTLVRAGIFHMGSCFEFKCQQLMDLIDEVAGQVTINRETLMIEDPVIKRLFGMLAILVGRLTLSGFSNEDAKSVRAARLVEIEQRRWESNPAENDEGDWRLIYLRNFWGRAYLRQQECLCRQCLGCYLPTSQPLPFSPLPPLVEEEVSDDPSSSSSEEE